MFDLSWPSEAGQETDPFISTAYAANAAMALAQKQIVKPLDMKALEGSIAAEVQKFAEMHFPAAKLTCKAD